MTGHGTGWELRTGQFTRLAVVLAMIAAIFVVVPPAHAALPDVGFLASTSAPLESAGVVDVTIELTTSGAALISPLVFDVVDAGSGTADGSDYSFTSPVPSLQFDIGDNNGATRTVSVTILQDDVVEPGKTVVLTLQPVSGGDIDPLAATHTLTITDDDTAGVSVVGSPVSATESAGPTGSYTVELTSQPTANVTVSVAGDTQVSPSVSSLLFTPTNWDTPQTVNVTAVDDDIVEASPHVGTITHGIVAGSAAEYLAVSVNDATVNITDNDFSVAFVLPSSFPVEGNSGPTLVDVDVVLDTQGRTLTSGATVEVYLSGGTATPGTDFTYASPTTVTFPSGSADGTIIPVTITVIDDAANEPNETVILGMQNVSANGSIVSPVSHTLTILDDDGPPGLSVLDATPVAEGSGSVLFTVVLLPASGLDVSVNYATANGTATSPADYTATSGTLNFLAGETSKDITVPITNDSLDEIAETLLLDLSGEVSASIADAQGVGTILDDDNVAPDAAIQITDQAGNPSIEFGAGETVKVTVTFTDPGAADTHNVTLDWGDGTAQEVFVISPAGTRSFIRTHTYASADLYQISASVSDADGGSDSVSGFVSVTGSAGGGAYKTGLVDTSQGRWYLYDDAGVLVTSFYYGNPGDVPFMGDWDGDGIETPGLYRQSDGFVYIKNTNTQGNADISFFFGNPGDVPIAGDFNGDGFDTVSIYRPSNQTFYIINELGKDGGGLGAAEFSYVFGNPGDKPFVGDFDGDGIETVGLHRESTGLVYFRNTHTQGDANNEFLFGNPGDRLVAGDWTGDGVFTPALFRPSSTTMFLKYTNSQGNADNQFVPTPANPAWFPISGVTGF